MNYKEAVDMLINGNKSDFKEWLKKCSKRDMLEAIEYSTQYQSRHVLIYTMLLMLEVK